VVATRGVRAFAGFTLIEVLIVVAIVAILAAIAYPSYQAHLQRIGRGQRAGEHLRRRSVGALCRWWPAAIAGYRQCPGR
jgi:prepilin-type N-terminal cleavage/methylation domain-containing protein